MSEENRRIAGRYQLAEQLGGGAMGLVWRAQDQRLDRVVAVKELLLPSYLDEKAAQQARRRAMREARIAARLQHPNAIAVYDVVEHDGQPWLIMEYLPSKSLALVIAENGPLPVDSVIQIGGQLAAALAAAHKVNVVHRDVKPGNVLLGDAGAVKITDFGISRAIDDATATATGRSVGTPAFFSPEVAKGEEGGYPSDVFSLGATLYNAVEGMPPFGISENSIAQLHRVAEGTIRPPERAGALTPVLLRLLDPDPDTRPTMPEAAEELAVLAEIREPVPTLVDREPVGEPPAAAAPVETPEPAPATPPAPAPVVAAAPSTPQAQEAPAAAPSTEDDQKRKRAIFGLVGVIVLLLAVVGLAFWIANRDKTPEGQATPSSSSSAPVPTTTGGGEQPAQTTGETTSTTSEAPATTTSEPPPASNTQPASTGTAAQALTDYYAGLLGNKEASYAKLTDAFKASGRAPTFADYSSFWNGYSAVSATNVVEQSPGVVSATINYVHTDGVPETETRTFTLVQQGGQWLIDNQR
ncbi:serine/threonine-protein kinase [Umezawaea sp. Da 62-37]|uniref:serine/threonine-protein kinase n=1 Tax=Umezawaea sp. Da 62-37 TaxID=3075927 RepID=UPI0028F739AB|nr:serine/threonine-protein kinase [Umezawaea sp. Da 62-37]WNV88563.1 serine/threonine-protein kinase [Umezawaea sp. Da 62-37]